jgi:hypothetical protein
MTTTARRRRPTTSEQVATQPHAIRNPMPSRRCGRRTRGGGQCTQWAMLGQTVCRMHGGSAPQAKKAAAVRIAELVDAALTELERLLTEADSDAVRLAAVKDVLDRHMGRSSQHVDVTGAGQPLIKSLTAEDAALLELPDGPEDR